MPRSIAINGRFLSQRLTGVQRYAREVVRALDRHIAADPEGLGRHRWRLVVPPDAQDDLPLTAIERETVAGGSGHRWEQWTLARATRGDTLVNLCNAGPVLHRDSIVVIHDAAVFRTPDNYSPAYRTAHRLLGRVLARRARIGTVSQFSRRELGAVLGLQPDAIFVAGNGADHLVGRPHEESTLATLGLSPRHYFLFVGSPAPNKNLGLAVDAVRLLQPIDAPLVVVGAANGTVLGGTALSESPGVRLLGARGDAEIAALYAGAAALVFPSRYEGFGIPPMEALAMGCPVLAGDIPVLRETLGDAATFIDIDDPQALADAMRACLDAPPTHQWHATAAAQLARHRWDQSAAILADAILAGPAA